MLTVEESINRAKAVHGDKYDYSKFIYVKNNIKACIICPKHGEFWQTPRDHFRGSGCPKCAIEKNAKRCRDTKESFIEKAYVIHSDKYLYANVVYKNAHTKVCITCPKHGDFYQIPNNHLNGCGCPKCRSENISSMLKGELDEFIKRSNIIHNNKYIYSFVEYKNARDYVKIICPEHGEFWQIPDSHLRGHGCPKCAKSVSLPELEICNIIKPIEFVERERTILEGKEIDIYVPSFNIGIEYDGLIWHSEKFGKDKNYHLWKLNKCKEKGVELIQIFEDEWLNHKDVCIFYLKKVFNINKQRVISFQGCEYMYVDDKSVINSFLNKNTIRGEVGFSKCVGAFYNGELIACMTFRKSKNDFIINCIAFDINYSYDGLEGKMLEFFISNDKCNNIILFVDRRWHINENDSVYIRIGFKLDSYTKPRKWYVCNGRKRLLVDKDGKNNPIYDCGQIKYVYHLEN